VAGVRGERVSAAPALALSLAVAAAAAAPLAAQSVTLRLGGFRASYADSLRGSAASAGADLSWGGAASAAALGGTMSTFTDGGWAAQASASFQHDFQRGLRHAVAALGDVAASAFTGGAWVGTATGGVAASLDVGPVAAGATLAAGGVRRLDGSENLLLTATGRVAHGAGAWTAEGWGALTAAGPVRYGDLGLGLRARPLAGRVTLDVAGGVRLGDLRDEWAQVRAAARIARGIWLEASAGRYPRDVTGFLHGAFVQAGVRLALRGGARGAVGPVVRRLRDDSVSIRFEVPDTGAVRVAGEWTGWRAEPLRRDGPRAWLLRARLAAGVYRFALVLDDGRWIVPPGAPAVPDDFGGSVGLLVVPR
jgi:hypothetical protein